jgi:hypothetical protein
MLGSRSEVLPPLYHDGFRGNMALAGPLFRPGFRPHMEKNEVLGLEQVMRVTFANKKFLANKKTL